MKTFRFQPARYAMVVFLVASLVVLPQYGVIAADVPNGVRIQMKTYLIPEPLPGMQITLPEGIPVEARADVLEAIQNTKPGGPPIIVGSSESFAKFGERIKESVDEAVDEALTVASAGSGTMPMLLGFAFWCVVVIAIIVVAVIVYVVWKLSQMIPPVQTNAPPTDPYPAFVGLGSTVLSKTIAGVDPHDAKSGHLNGWPALYSESPAPEIQANLDLGTTNWFVLCTLHASPVYEITNSFGSTYWVLITAVNPLGEVVASTFASGGTNVPITVFQQKPNLLRIPAPEPTPDKMFVRIR